jgi:hypothetical protein
MMLFAVIVKQNHDRAWKSLRHEDGEFCFGGGWFIVGIDTPEGSYTYHYENKYFDLFDCEILDYSKHWDGHTEKDVTRLLSLPNAQLTREGKTSDLISRTETVEHLRRVLEATVPNTDYDEGYVDGVEFGISTVSTMPTIQPEPQWIPVSERLPEEDGKYMVTIHGYGWNGKTFTSVSVAECIGKRWVGNNGVIAWMPLPEPYNPNK